MRSSADFDSAPVREYLLGLQQRIVGAFEAEDGKIEAKCTDIATQKPMEVYIDPATGKVADIKSED